MAPGAAPPAAAPPAASRADGALAALIGAVARGERAALRAVYDRQGPRLFGVANAILRDRDMAADALHDAFVKLAGRAAQFDPSRGAAEAWLAGIVRHAALDLARRRGREIPTGDPALGDAPVPAEALEQGLPSFLLEELLAMQARGPAALRAFLARVALQGAEAVTVVTEWQQFRSLDPAETAAKVTRPFVFDGRNVLDPEAWRAAGWTYTGMGRS